MRQLSGGTDPPDTLYASNPGTTRTTETPTDTMARDINKLTVVSVWTSAVVSVLEEHE